MNVQPAAALGGTSRPDIDARPAASRIRDGAADAAAPVQETQTTTAAQPVSKSQVEEADRKSVV